MNLRLSWRPELANFGIGTLAANVAGHPYPAIVGYDASSHPPGCPLPTEQAPSMRRGGTPPRGLGGGGPEERAAAGGAPYTVQPTPPLDRRGTHTHAHLRLT